MVSRARRRSTRWVHTCRLLSQHSVRVVPISNSFRQSLETPVRDPIVWAEVSTHPVLVQLFSQVLHAEQQACSVTGSASKVVQRNGEVYRLRGRTVPGGRTPCRESPDPCRTIVSAMAAVPPGTLACSGLSITCEERRDLSTSGPSLPAGLGGESRWVPVVEAEAFSAGLQVTAGGGRQDQTEGKRCACVHALPASGAPSAEAHGLAEG